MYLIRAVTVHSNRPKEVWFGPSAYTARILWSGGGTFFIESPRRPPLGALRGSLGSTSCRLCRAPPPTAAQASARLCRSVLALGFTRARSVGHASAPMAYPSTRHKPRTSPACPTVSKPSCSLCTTVSSPISLISSLFDFVFSDTYVFLFSLSSHVN